MGFWESLSDIFDLAFISLAKKFPESYRDPAKGFVVFELLEMMAEEIAAKNIELFTKPYFDQLVSVRDIPGETFYYSES